MAAREKQKKKTRWLWTIAIIAAVVMALNLFYGTSFWLTPNQQGRYAFDREQYAQAAGQFEDPLWKGIAYYANQEFDKAAAQFSRLNTPGGYFNLGNAWAHLKEYPKAIEAYRKALELQPDYPQAEANWDQVSLFIPKEREKTGGDMGSAIGADEIDVEGVRHVGV